VGSRIDNLNIDSIRIRLFVRTWSPGDGVTRYRFFKMSESNPSVQNYDGPHNGIYTALGIKEAETFLSGAGAIS